MKTFFIYKPNINNKELQDKYAIKNNEIPNTQKSYNTLRAKLDIHITKLYGLSKT